MKGFATRFPLLFSLLLTAALFGLTLLARAAYPTAVVGSVEDLSPEELAPPTGWDLFVSGVRNAETLYLALAALLAAALLSYMGWWGRAGFNKPAEWRNLRLLVFPALVGTLFLADGFRLPDAGPLAALLIALALTAFGQEAIFRGLMLGALASRGIILAVFVTTLLFGALQLGRGLLDEGGPPFETVYVTALAVGAGFAYAALRWRTNSLWPIILLSLYLGFARDVSTIGFRLYPLVMALSTLGFVAYGLFLLRNRRVRADRG